ncbi:isochorismatase family protein [Brenneria rubrifaciens]|uniref:isochorismatase n=1 Tax=Brenneria rubrifaciens TaxID=55213 RepID=A0A4P8QSC2_9GAMM|nr:isochorismatase family protein [Brenneria rubrifaciens]QCR08439.1 isochorismatase family protein [Brenneria rubrifaciens]
MSIPKLKSYDLPVQAALPVNKVNWPLATSRAALLIHDMQHYFLNFWEQDTPLVKRVVENIARLKKACRQQGIPVFYTAQPENQNDEERALLNDIWGAGLTHCAGQQGIVDALAPEKEDIVLTKWRYSAFQRSDLELMLKNSGRNQLIICGVYAHIGCLTTALDAFMRDIKPCMVADALADFSYEQHMMALCHTANCCGQVATTGGLVDALNSETPGWDNARLREVLLPLLDEDCGEIGDDENLLEYGLDSVRIMSLITRLHQEGYAVDFISLMKNPTFNGWQSLLDQCQGRVGMSGGINVSSRAGCGSGADN